MFSKGKAPEAPTSSMASPIPSAPAAPVKKSGGRSAPSIISADLLVQGALVSQGDMQIDGVQRHALARRAAVALGHPFETDHVSRRPARPPG